MMNNLTSDVPVEMNLGIFVVKTVAQWAIDELTYKGHHLSFDDLKQLHTAFRPLFAVDPDAIDCFAHQRAKEQNNPKTDIILPEYSKATLSLPQLDRHAVKEVKRSMATITAFS